MTQEELSTLTDQELLEEAKKLKSNSMINAIFIGILIGIVIYGVAKNNLGFFTLIPLFIVYTLFKNSKSQKAKAEHNKALERLLKERDLK